METKISKCVAHFNTLGKAEQTSVLRSMFYELLSSESMNVDDDGIPYWDANGCRLGEDE